MGALHVFVAGGTGTIGVPLVRALVAAGHEVTALTRSPGKLDGIRALGARPAVADALDPAALRAALAAARPTHVVHQLTALPKAGVKRARDLRPTNRLRAEGTRNLLDAALRAGARRFIGGSFALFQAPIPRDAPPDVIAGAEALRSMESQILEASARGQIEGIVLRYGLFYGPGNPTTERMVKLVRRRMLPVVRDDRGLLPVIHLADAVSATLAALDRGPAGGAYDVVDDRPVSMSEIVRELAARAGAPPPLVVPPWLPRLLSPYMARFMSMRLPLSNARTRAELGWQPAYPTWRDGLSHMLERAA